MILGTGSSNFPWSALELVTEKKERDGEREATLDDLDSGITSHGELTRPRRFTRRAIRSRRARISAVLIECDNDDTTIKDDTTQVVGARDRSLVLEKRETEGNRKTRERERMLRSRGRGKNCAAEARLVSRWFPAAITDVTIECIDWPGREPSRDWNTSLRSLAASLFCLPSRGTSAPSAVPRRETLFRPLSFHPSVRVAAPLPPLPSSTHPLSIAPHPSTSTFSLARVSCSAILLCICRLAIIFPLSPSLFAAWLENLKYSIIDRIFFPFFHRFNDIWIIINDNRCIFMILIYCLDLTFRN